jgi:hypothetical protein
MNAFIESLEHRTLMSATWTTVDADPTAVGIQGMAADKAGNVYNISFTDNDATATHVRRAPQRDRRPMDDRPDQERYDVYGHHNGRGG